MIFTTLLEREEHDITNAKTRLNALHCTKNRRQGTCLAGEF